MSCWRNSALRAVIQTEQMSARLGQDTGVNWRKQAKLARQAVGKHQRHRQDVPVSHVVELWGSHRTSVWSCPPFRDLG